MSAGLLMQNSCDVIVTNASVVMPMVGIVETNIMIEGGRIKSLVKSPANIQASRTINASGKYVLPGAIDPHVHYGVYTPIDEAAKTESRSAAVGGVTTIMRMLRLCGSYTRIQKQLEASGGRHFVDYAVHASILKPEQVHEMQYLKQTGINSFKIYMNLGAELNHILADIEPETYATMDCEVNMDDSLLSSIIEKAAGLNAICLVHAEDPAVCSEYIKSGKERGLSGLKAWSDCRPPSSEASSVTKVCEIGRRFAGSLYFVHIGSTAALDAILAQREKGNLGVYVETCPHYLTHTIDYESVNGKVVPPLRSKSDLQSTWSALKNGIIDTVGTDHVANRIAAKTGKGDIWSALAGFPGVATMLPVLLGKGVNEGRISLERVVEVTSYNTSRIFGLYPKKGTLQEGSDADLTIVDLDLEQTVTPDLLQSYSDYTVYDGWKIRGWPIMTLVRGKVVMEGGKVDEGSLGHGKYIARPVEPAEISP